MKRAQGLDKLVFVPGNHGEKFAGQMGIHPRYVVVMSNFVRYVLKDAERLGFKRVVLLGHFGKLVKVASGIFHTHSHIADGRLETLIAHLALMGAPRTLLLQIDECKTTEAAMGLINEAGFQAVYEKIAIRIKKRTEELSQYTKNPMRADAVVCTMDGTILGSSIPPADLIEEFRT